uniref:Direct IAP-binding protein with low pI n=1 Tax=Astyanax mexicanus TaxID=7994 RepID=A0A3B1J861_ASTMX
MLCSVCPGAAGGAVELCGVVLCCVKGKHGAVQEEGALCGLDNMTHETLIRRASSLVTNSANTYLSQTTLALLDSLTAYTDTVRTLITLHKSYVSNFQKLNPTQEDKIWQMIVCKRQEVANLREDCKKFETHWMTAIKLSDKAAEAAFNAGADQASATVHSNLHTAQSQIQQVRQLLTEAEKELKESKAEESERLQLETQEEEIPEAYLRED